MNKGEDDKTDDGFCQELPAGYEADPNQEMVQECCPNVNKQLLVNKFWYFFFFGANGSLMPYLILYFKQLGLTPSQVGIVSGLKPFISFVCSPFWGYLADKTGKTKFIYIISILAYGGGYVGYSFAPSKHVCTFNTNLSETHAQVGSTHIHRRNTKTSSTEDLNSLQLNQINKRDLLGLDNYFRRKLIPDRKKRLPMYTNIRNQTARRQKIETYGPTYHHMLYPAENEFSLFQSPASLQILTLAEEKVTNDTSHTIVPVEATRIFSGESILEEPPNKESWIEAVRHPNSPWTVCAAAKVNAIDSINFQAREKPDNLDHIFSFLLIITLVATIFSCPLITIVDTATIRKLKETLETHLYGKQRLWGSFAWGIFSFSIGAILSLLPLCGTKHNEVNYFPAFYIFASLLVVAMLIGLKLKFDNVPAEDITATTPTCSRTQKILEGLKLLKDPIYFYFIVTSFYIGMTMSIIKTFLFWHLKDLGAPQILFSIIAAVNCCAEVFVYYFSSLFIKRVGHIRVIYIALICYSLRLFYYGLLKKPWYVLAAEPLSGITTAAAWSTMTSYVGLNANSESVTTMQGILHGVHWGLGHGCGELLGGFMVSWVGAAMTFNLFGVATIIELLFFVLLNSLNSRKVAAAEATATEATEATETVESCTDESKTNQK